MPLYEYVCQKCSRRTEVIQAFGERRIRMCPHCGGKVKKAFSAPAIQFKGSGFYITDYAKGKTGDAGSSSKSESGKSESGKSESGKSESAKAESGKSDAGEKPAEKKKEKESKGKKASKD